MVVGLTARMVCPVSSLVQYAFQCTLKFTLEIFGFDSLRYDFGYFVNTKYQLTCWYFSLIFILRLTCCAHSNVRKLINQPPLFTYIRLLLLLCSAFPRLLYLLLDFLIALPTLLDVYLCNLKDNIFFLAD